MRNWISQEIAMNHRGKLYGAIAGFVIGLFLIHFGILKTLILIFFTVGGYVAGGRLDTANEDIFDTLDRILPTDQD
jgi:uncharacterized membrane protein